METAVKEVNELLSGQTYGILSTHSVEFQGHPFGSLVAYCLDENGRPIIQISALAQHTKNIAKDPKVSLTVSDVKDGDIQNSKRVVYLANAVKILSTDRTARERYYTAFPSAKGYGEMLDFAFYRLEKVAIHYVGGFGRVFRL